MVHRALIALLLLGVVSGGARMGLWAIFSDAEQIAANTFAAGVWGDWLQTTEAEFNTGVLSQVDTSTSTGNVLLSFGPNPTLETSDNSEVATTSTSWELQKTLTFTKDGISYDELRIDSNLKRQIGLEITAYSSIRVDDVEKFSHSTTSDSYVSYNDVIDFSGYSDGEHTIKLYLMSSGIMTADNSVFELYRTEAYASPGTIASQVYDTGASGTEMTQLSWSETLPAGTDITFEARASDSPFAKDASSPSWDSVGGTSPVTSGLSSGRYMQWRATLTATDNAYTPQLHDVTVDYSS